MAQLPRDRHIYAKSPITHAFISVSFDALAQTFNFDALGMQLDQSLLAIPSDGEAVRWDAHQLVREENSATITGVVIRAENKKTFVQVTTTSCVVLRVAPYERWERFVAVVKNVWETFTSFAQIGSLTRIGARYINQFQPVDETVLLESVLNVSLNTPSMPMPRREQLITVVFEDDDVELEVSVNDGPGENAEGKQGRRIILDLDSVVREHVLPVIGTDISAILEKLHVCIDSAFETCITQETRGSLK